MLRPCLSSWSFLISLAIFPAKLVESLVKQAISFLFWKIMVAIPIVRLARRTAVQRCDAPILTALGLTTSVTESPERYVKAALFLSEIVGKIPDLRQNACKAFLASPFTDDIGLVCSVEAMFRDIGRWRRVGEDSRQPRKAG